MTNLGGGNAPGGARRQLGERSLQRGIILGQRPYRGEAVDQSNSWPTVRGDCSISSSLHGD